MIRIFVITVLILISGCFSVLVLAHPLGNFVINHYSHLEIANKSVDIHYIIDMAEIATLQELEGMPKYPDGSRSLKELNQYRDRVAAQYANGLILRVDDTQIPLQITSKVINLPPGAGKLSTLFLVCDFHGELPSINSNSIHQLTFIDTNFPGRLGWNEIMVSSIDGIKIFNSTAFGNDVTDELTNYPENITDQLLAERSATLSFTSGPLPPNATPLQKRDTRQTTTNRSDKFVELISAPQLSFSVILIGLLVAASLGGLHALSPGHGKTIVGAYLVGSRGTAMHAVFLGLTVTITHTLGVFLLGLITLYATQYVVPEKLFPIISVISGLMVVAIGLSLMVSRLRSWSKNNAKVPAINNADLDVDQHLANNSHENIDELTTHSHGGLQHSHLPPSRDDLKLSWRKLLALGISGGLLPCPSALVVLLAAISLHRIGYGLVLVLSFSFGLAAVLTLIGLLFLYAGKFFNLSGRSNRWTQLVPTISALVITLAGSAICWQAGWQAYQIIFRR